MVWAQLITSKTRVRLLEYLFAHPSEKVYLRGLERIFNEPATPIRRELQKLEAMGLLKSVFEANVKYYAVDTASQVYGQLRPLMIPETQPSAAAQPAADPSTKPQLEPVLISVKRRDALPSWGWAVAGLVGFAVIFTLIAAMRTQQQLAAVQQQLRAATARPVTVQVVPAPDPLPNESRSQQWRVMPGSWSAVAPPGATVPAESGAHDGRSY